MIDADKITDEEFLEELAARLKSSGHGLIFVDRGLIRFSKFAATFLGMFLLIGIVFFGIDLEQAVDELQSVSKEMEAARQELGEIQSSARFESKNIIKEINDILSDVERIKNDIEKEVNLANNLTKDSIRSTLSSMTELVSQNVPKHEFKKLREFYTANLDFAKREELPLVRIELLSKLAYFEWWAGDRPKSRDYYDQAVKMALEHGEQGIAGVVLVQAAELENTRSEEDGQVAFARANRLSSRALRIFEASDDAAGKAAALRLLAITYVLAGNDVQALDYLQKARRQYRDLDTKGGGELDVVSTLAEFHQQRDNPADAIIYYSESVSIAEKLQKYLFASDYALKLAALHEEGHLRLTYLCAAWKYFDQAYLNRPKILARAMKRFQPKIELIDRSFEYEANCGGSQE